MARIRTIKPEFWTHEALSSLPEATHMLAAALLNYADDDGYFNANPRLIQAACCPLREPSVSIHDSLIHLSNVGYLRVGTSIDGRRYGHIIHFAEHQRVNRPSDSKIKGLEIAWDDSLNTHGAFTEPSSPEGKGKEQGTGNREGKGIISAPNGAHGPDGPRSSSKAFAEFWDCWDIPGTKRGRDATKRKFETAIKSGVDHETLCEGVRRYMVWARRNRVEIQFIKHPSTWLSKGCWSDELPDRNHQESTDEWAERLARETADDYGWGSH